MPARLELNLNLNPPVASYPPTLLKLAFANTTSTKLDQTMANVDSPPLYQASLDPLNTPRFDLKPPFMPHKYRLRSEVRAIVLCEIKLSTHAHYQDVQYIFDMPGFTTLPRILVPRASSTLMPPIMHYGWPIKMNFLINYAEQHGLLRYFQKLVPDENEDLDEDSDEEKETKVINIVNSYGSAIQALDHIVELVGGSTMPLHVELRSVCQRHSPMVVSLFTNYTLTSAPTDEFKSALCEQLQLTGEPRWYLGRIDGLWQTEIPECMLNEDSGLCLMEEVGEEEE